MTGTATYLPSPKFRTTSRLAQWVRRMKPTSRLAPESELCFFRSKEKPSVISGNLCKYSEYVGEVSQELEAVLEQGELFSYSVIVARRLKWPRDSVMERLTPSELVRLSSYRGQRLSAPFESRIVEPMDVVSYFESMGEIVPEMEDLILGCPNACMRYTKFLTQKSKPIEEKVLRKMVGHDRHFLELCTRLNGRLPDYLLESITDPEVALQYAVRHLKGRLPEHVEDVLATSARCAVRYAFEVIRAYSDPTLPEKLHQAVILHSCGDPNNHEIKRYTHEVARFSKKTDDGRIQG